MPCYFEYQPFPRTVRGYGLQLGRCLLQGCKQQLMVNEENSILVDYDPIQIADRMEYYFNHPDELATIRKKGMDFVKGTSWYKEAEKVYASMLKGIEEDEKKLQ